MKKLDACVGDLVEWYDYKGKRVVSSDIHNMILIFNDQTTYCLYSSLRGFYEINYQQKYITTFPRKIK